VNVHHGSPGFVRGLYGFSDLIGCFGNNFVGFFTLDAAIAGDANDEWRHAGTDALHEFVAVSVIETCGKLGFDIGHDLPYGAINCELCVRKIKALPKQAGIAKLTFRGNRGSHLAASEIVRNDFLAAKLWHDQESI
jgi:hypothetical protein